MITNFRSEFVTGYPTAVQLYEKAHMRLAEGDADDTLTAARKSLEFFAKGFSGRCGLPVQDPDTGLGLSNEELINNLTACGWIGTDEAEIFHRLRKLGNVGSHDMGSMQEAQEAVDLLDKAVMIFAERDARMSGQRETAARYNDAPHLGFFARILANAPYLYRVVVQFTLAPLIPPMYLVSYLMRESMGTLMLLLAMIVFVISTWLYGKLTVWFNAIPVPEGVLTGMTATAVKWLGVVSLCVVMVMMLWISASCPFIDKIIIWAAMLLCVIVNPILGSIMRSLFGWKV